MTLKIRKPSSWELPARVNRWTGSSWVTNKALKRWDGSSWVVEWAAAPDVQAPGAPYSATHYTWFGTTASCSLRVDSDGDITRNGSFDIDNWVDDKSSLDGNDFEVIATKTSGDTPNGTLGSYLSLNQNRTWSFSVTNGTKSCQLQVTIRQKTDHSNSVTFNMTLTATSNSGPPQ